MFAFNFSLILVASSLSMAQAQTPVVASAVLAHEASSPITRNALGTARAADLPAQQPQINPGQPQASQSRHTPTPRPTPTPTPTAKPTATPTPPAGAPKAPVGIYYLTATDAPISAVQSCWSNKSVAGVALRKSASSIVKSANTATWDWSQLDAASALAKSNGKKWTVGVQWGPTTPSFVGAKFYPLSGGSSPVPWDAKLLPIELQFIQAFGARYDGDSNLVGVVIGGLGANSGLESYVAQTSADSQLIAPAGGAPQWIAAAQQIISAYTAAFPHTGAIMAAAVPFPNDDDSLNTIGDWGAATYSNFGVMCCSLKVGSTVTYEPNALVSTYAASHPCGFQCVAPASDTSRTGGSLSQVLAVGGTLLQWHGFIQVYGVDCDKAANSAVLITTGQQLAQGDKDSMMADNSTSVSR